MILVLLCRSVLNVPRCLVRNLRVQKNVMPYAEVMRTDCLHGISGRYDVFLLFSARDVDVIVFFGGEGRVCSGCMSFFYS